MSESVEDLKRCSKCEKISLESNVYRHKLTKGKLNPICKICSKNYCNEKLRKINEYYSDNRDRIKNYYSENYDKIIPRKKFFLIIEIKQILFFVQVITQEVEFIMFGEVYRNHLHLRNFRE